MQASHFGVLHTPTPILNHQTTSRDLFPHTATTRERLLDANKTPAHEAFDQSQNGALKTLKMFCQYVTALTVMPAAPSAHPKRHALHLSYFH